MIITQKDGTILRQANQEDMTAIDEITIVGYTHIQESYVAMLGIECYQAVRHQPLLSWKERKTGQNHKLFAEHPEWVWVLEHEKGVFGFVTFMLFPEKNYGHIENNGVIPEYAGQGWGKFMYRNVLQFFRNQGLRFAHVDTGLDDAHIPARKAYEAVGFDRPVPFVEYWQDLSENNEGSIPD